MSLGSMLIGASIEERKAQVASAVDNRALDIWAQGETTKSNNELQVAILHNRNTLLEKIDKIAPEYQGLALKEAGIIGSLPETPAAPAQKDDRLDQVIQLMSVLADKVNNLEAKATA